jgi:uncharacterized protein (DUF4415 family)
MSAKFLTLPDGRKIEVPSPAEDAAIHAGIAADPDTRELDAAWFADAKPAAEVLPPELYAGLVAMNRRAGVRGPQKAPLKRPTTIRFDADVLEALKATGKGWQTRVNEAMREWVKTHRA